MAGKRSLIDETEGASTPAPTKRPRAKRAKKTGKKRKKAPGTKKRRTPGLPTGRRAGKPQPKAAPGDENAVELSPGEALDLFARLTAPEPPEDSPGGAGSSEETPEDTAPADAGGGAASIECAESAESAPKASAVEETRPLRSSRIRTRVLSSILKASCRVLTYESADVEAGMRVAGSTLARLYGFVREYGLDISLGPICQTREEFVAEWDNTPAEMPVVILANLSFAQGFLPAVVEERPRVASAYWVAFETLRGDVSTATNDFLAELRSRNRLRAIGFGPRNILDAVRRGSEAVRGHVEWGFGRGPLAEAG